MAFLKDMALHRLFDTNSCIGKGLLSAFCLTVSILFLSACDFSVSPDPEGPDPRFRTTPPSHLFFLNTRSSAYQKTSDPDTRIDHYRLRQWGQQDQTPPILPVIADNWLQEEAYLLLEQPGGRENLSDSTQIFWKSKDDSGHFFLISRDTLAQLDLALEINRALQAGHELRLARPGDAREVLLFENLSERRLFAQTLRDYLKLVERQ